MTVLVDTSVWSLALRRSRGPVPAEAVALAALVRAGRVAVIGPVRQELLSGVKSGEQFQALQERLRQFPDTRLDTADFELAAQFFNQCRGRGVQGSNTDFLICAVAFRRQHSVFTTDRDFTAFAKVLPVALHAPGA